MKAIVAEATKSPRNWKLAISVADTHGELVYFYKMDNTQHGSVTISQNKARTSARLRRPTQIFNTVMQNPAGAYIGTLDSPPPTASPGGIPLIEGGKIIGAVGCSGATGRPGCRRLQGRRRHGGVGGASRSVRHSPGPPAGRTRNPLSLISAVKWISGSPYARPRNDGGG